LVSKDNIDDRKSMLAKTARLKALRLAKEAEELATAEAAAPAKKPTVRKAAVRKKAPAPWPWAASSARKPDEA